MCRYKIYCVPSLKLILLSALYLVLPARFTNAQEIKVALSPMADRQHISLIMNKGAVENAKDYKGLDLSRYKLGSYTITLFMATKRLMRWLGWNI